MQKFINYLNTLSRINDLGQGDPVQWHFHCGMLFLAQNKWWGDFKLRSSIHEGIDITYYTTLSGKWQEFDETVLVPAMASGIVLNICDDFLGRTIVTQSFLPTGNLKTRILLAYAHIQPWQGIQRNSIVMEKSVLATVCKSKKKPPQLPPHLHLSCFEVPNNIPADDLNWNLFSKSPDVRLIHPLFV